MVITLGLGILAAGALFLILGLIFLFRHSGAAGIVVGLILAVAGAGGAFVGYDMDQRSEVTYTVGSVVDQYSGTVANSQYTVELKVAEGMTLFGDTTMIYVSGDQVDTYKTGETITLTKRQLKALQTQKNS